jgi:ATP-dependent Clp protease adapter protein ClpS
MTKPETRNQNQTRMTKTRRKIVSVILVSDLILVSGFVIRIFSSFSSLQFFTGGHQ